jgi:hypothetical protein
MNRTASVLLILKVTLLIRPYLTANSPAFIKASWMSLTAFFRARKADDFIILF